MAEEEPNVSAEIVLYQQDGRNVPVEVTYCDETFWLSQQKMADLFGVDVRTVNEHLRNIYGTGELTESATIRKFRIVRTEGARNVAREIMFYDLDAIIAVGYRVNSMQATRFRQWATGTLREYIVKGFVLNDDMLKNGRPFGQDYFDELLERIRDIRASERRVWLKITDIFQDLTSDYDKSSKQAKMLYATMQNKMHHAASGHTAAEIINIRADATKPHMGLTTWKGSPEGRIHSTDVTVAKNYLSEEEISRLNTLVSGLLDVMEARARSHMLTSMSECLQLIDQYVLLTGGQVLEGNGRVRKSTADKKAKEEFRKFNETQANDFEKMSRHVTGGDPWGAPSSR